MTEIIKVEVQEESSGEANLRRVLEVLEGRRELTPELLEWFRSAIRRIRAGGSVREALDIYRKTGRKRRTFHSAWDHCVAVDARMRKLKDDGLKGPIYERAVNEIAEETCVSPGTIKRHYSDFKDCLPAMRRLARAAASLAKLHSSLKN